MNKKKIWFLPFMLFLFTLFISVSAWAVSPYINYQGKLTDSSGAPINAPALAMDFSIWLDPISTDFADMVWQESHIVTVAEGIYNVSLGSIISLGSPDVMGSHNDLWLEVNVEGETLSPRSQLTSVPAAFWADVAADADTLDGLESTDFIVSSKYGLHTADASAHHAKTTSFSELTDQATDAQIPAAFTRDSELVWGNIAKIPDDFADGIDNNTTYAAGTGLNLTGSTFNLNVPLTMSSANSNPILSAYNSGTGFGLYGWGYIGVYGATASGTAVYGYNNNKNVGRLGSQDHAVYGSSPSGYAGYFDGKTQVNGNLLIPATGKVGIGTITPTESLSVAGNTKISGVLSPDGGIYTSSGIAIESKGSNVIIIAGPSRITVDPAGGVTIESTGNVTLQADGDLNLTGENVNITSAVNTTIHSGSETNISSATKTSIDSDISTIINGSSILDLNGGIITLN